MTNESAARLSFCHSCKQPSGPYHQEHCRAWEGAKEIDPDPLNRLAVRLLHLGTLPEGRLQEILGAATAAAYERLHHVARSVPDDVARIEANLQKHAARLRLLAARAKEYTLPGPRLMAVDHLRDLAGALEELATDIERSEA